MPPNTNPQSGAHYRRESSHSLQGENRGNFPPQGGRGRGFNPHAGNYNNQMGYPPNNQFRNGPGQGRGMPPSFQPQPRNMPYPNSPQPTRSPALVPSMPNTPNMASATMQPNMPMQTPPQYHYPPPMAPQHQQVQLPLPVVHEKFPVKPHKRGSKARREQAKSLQLGRYQSDPTRELHDGDHNMHPRRYNQRPEQQWRHHDMNSKRIASNCATKQAAMPFQTPNLPTMPKLPSHTPSAPLDLSPENGVFEHWLTWKYQNYGYPPQQQDQYALRTMYSGYSNVPPYMTGPQANSPGYNGQFPPQYHPQSHGMARTPSQPDRPSSANQQSQPLVVGSAQSPSTAPGKPAAPNNFVKPRKSAAIQIKNAAGEVVDTSTFKQPASPAPSSQPSKTPPVVASTPTPPPKAATPSHARTESTATPKTAKEIQDELKEKIKQATQGAGAGEAKIKEATSAAPAVAEQPATAVPAGAPKTEEPKKVEEPKKASEEKAAEPAKTEDPDEDEMERMIREMEEADAKREKEEEEHRMRREAEKAAQKVKDDENRKANAVEEDRKLREQEREMERLEEEKERRQKEAEGSGKALSVAEALALEEGGGKDSDKESDNVESVADKLADMKLGEDGKPVVDAAGQKRSGKPAALNLAPLNTKPVEPAQPSAALQSLKSARFLQVMDQDIYPTGVSSPNPALNAAVTKKGKSFKYDAAFLLQFQKVFTEQPSLEFHQQVKSLIGDGDRSARAQTPRQASNRGGGGGGFAMGTFNAPPGRTLPPGTSSADRMAMSSGTMPRPAPGSIGSFRGGPGSSFPMARTSSQSKGVPNSPGGGRQSNRSTRGSRRGDVVAKEAQAAKTMPLTAGQEIKPIAITSSGWKPASITGKGAASGPTASGYLDPEMVQRKVKAALNKMTPEKFDRIADQILVIASQSKDESDGRTLRQVIQLTFEKATDEAHWASMYAKFCKRMLENMSADVRDEGIKDKNGNVVSGGNLFRKYLLNRCQEEFERGWSSHLPEPKEAEEGAAEANKKTDAAQGEAAMLSDEYYIAAAAKRRGLGLVQFIGELYKLGMLTERIMHECVHKLVDYKGIPDEAEIESLSKLLRTIGANLDNTEKGRPMMDAYFQRIQNMAELPELHSRMKFMLMDVLDLRRANWVSKEGNKGPKTLEEVRADAEAAAAAKAQESVRSNQRGGGPGRPPIGRGDARNFSSGYTQQTSNQVGMDDLRRLKGSASRTSSQNVTLGPTSMFSSRSNSGRRMGPGGSLGRPGEESGASSRTGTPPTTRDSTSNTNAFR